MKISVTKISRLYNTTGVNNYQDYLDYFGDFIIQGVCSETVRQIVESQELKNIMVIGKQFCCINSYLLADNDFVYTTPNVKDVIGYAPEELSNQKLYELIHPAERSLILKATIKSIDIQKKHRVEPLKYVFHMNYRLMKKDGIYIRVLRQTTNFKNDKNGLMYMSLSIITDISNYNTNNSFNFHITGPNNKDIVFPDDELLQNQPNLSKREKEVIKLLAKGELSKTIASKLHISKYTVDTHRSNILQKLNLRNTAEIIAYANEYNLL